MNKSYWKKEKPFEDYVYINNNHDLFFGIYIFGGFYGSLNSFIGNGYKKTLEMGVKYIATLQITSFCTILLGGDMLNNCTNLTDVEFG